MSKGETADSSKRPVPAVSLPATSPVPPTVTSLFATVDQLVRRRALFKGKITIAVNSVKPDSGEPVRLTAVEMISSHLERVRALDEQINEVLLVDVPDPDEVNKRLEKEVNDQANYERSVKVLVNKFNSNSSQASETSAVPLPNYDAKLPNLNCSTFSGEGSSNLDYFSFHSQFQNVVGLRGNLSDATKFTYLKSYLRGYALKLVQHLQVSNQNYQVALELLSAEFLNKEALVDDFIKRLLELKPKLDSSYLGCKIYLNEIRCILSDLKLNNVDVLAENSAKLIVSHVVFNCLPTAFQHELISKLGTSFPNVEQIFETYADIVRTLNLKSSSSPPKFEKSRDKRSVSTNFATDVYRKFCKFCACNNHTMLHCKRYVTVNDRKARCRELGLCPLCSSSKHRESGCNTKLDFQCKFCNSSNHISALCNKSVPVSTNVCINTSSRSKSHNVLPTMTIKISKGGKSTEISCLIDTGSQRTYVHGAALDRIDFPKDRLEHSYSIDNFLMGGHKKLSEVSLSIDLCDGMGYFQLPVYIDNKFHLKYGIENLDLAMHNLSNCDLADNNSNSGNTVRLEGALGVDCIQYFKDLRLVKCMQGAAISVSGRIAPIGDVQHFLTKTQVANLPIPSDPEQTDPADSTLINFVLDPKGKEFDPIACTLTESQVEGHLDKMFRVESIGLKEDPTDELVEDPRVGEFASNIEFYDGSYYVDLPWYNDKISQVKSNFNVALSVLDRVIPNLKSKGILESYSAIFQQQLKDGIIEEIDLNKINVHDNIWIPHRPVCKSESQVTTKVRAVLNCSLKRGQSPSLNEAAFPGIDLLGNLLKLLIGIRHDDFLVLSDIKSAFLQIKLKTDYDKNKFCILFRDSDGTLRAYRYCTLVFGYAASPFILNYVIRHHLKQFPADKFRCALENQMYVDNLFITGNSDAELLQMYNVTMDIMRAGGFTLRSWASNNDSLNRQFSSDSTGVIHDSKHERVLGYRYDKEKDSLSLAEADDNIGSQATTKREILSIFSKFFDPLGLCLPISIKGKTILRQIWVKGTTWDENVSDEILKQWKSLAEDLFLARSFSFPRKILSTGDNIDLIIFCDASKELYGCAFYIVTDRQSSSLVYAKSKVAPIKHKSLPTLELLSIFLAFKCLESVIESLKEVKIRSVHMCGDSQIVLSWILSETVKTKNIFARNRVKDITEFRANLRTSHDLDCKFHFVPTNLNPADLITRGLSCQQLLNNFDFWISGPKFLKEHPVDWPSSTLNCLSEKSKLLANSVVQEPTASPIISVEKYSDLHKLLRITAYVLKFISKLRRKSVPFVDHIREANILLLKQEQRVAFREEIDFIESSSRSSNIPTLVNNLNLLFILVIVLGRFFIISFCLYFCGVDMC